MTIIVTGAAGFIGANNVKALNDRGERDILAVDHLAQADKFHNLVDCDIADYLDKHDFLDAVRRGTLPKPDVVFHQGACSDTMATDGRYVIENNYRFSLELFRWCQEQKVPLIYASSAAVYGRGPDFVENRANERPFNIYGYSKFLFDVVVRRQLADVAAPVVGLRYFNVYGPRESHKGRMASVAFHAFQPVPRIWRRKALPEQPRLCERRTAAGFCSRGRRRRRQSALLAATGVRHLQRRHRPRTKF